MLNVLFKEYLRGNRTKENSQWSIVMAKLLSASIELVHFNLFEVHSAKQKRSCISQMPDSNTSCCPTLRLSYIISYVKPCCNHYKIIEN